MAVPIRIRVGDLALEGELGDSSCARAVAEALPVRGRFTVWGDQITMEIPVDHRERRPGAVEVEVGDLGYWPEGRALCIFFGPTPLSPEEAPVAPAQVHRIGSIRGAEALRGTKEAPELVVERGGGETAG